MKLRHKVALNVLLLLAAILANTVAHAGGASVSWDQPHGNPGIMVIVTIAAIIFLL